MLIRRGACWLQLFALLCLVGLAQAMDKAPFPYVWGTAYHVLPGTHNNEEGYFSLCQAHNGKLYLGTACDRLNAYLVEFDPATAQQRVAVDTNQLCGATGTGNAAQAEIHTRNFVGPSGTIYFGSFHGSFRQDDPSVYPGGYVMTYHPETGQGACLGIPAPGEAITDVIADEARGVLYVTTMGESRWFRYEIRTKTYRALGPRVLSFAGTLLDARGRAHVLTTDFQLATYDPKTDRVTTRDILVDGRRWQPASNIPIWVMAQDRRTAYLVMMADPTLLRFDLLAPGPAVRAANLGKMIDGTAPDSRAGLTIGADGNVYALFRVNNETGFGTGYLHYLLRYTPKTQTHERLGVLAVTNPDFFAWKAPDGKPAPFSHGYHTLPDGTLTPYWNHMSLIAGTDNTLYATIIYPFTLLKIEAYRLAKTK